MKKQLLRFQGSWEALIRAEKYFDWLKEDVIRVACRLRPLIIQVARTDTFSRAPQDLQILPP